jgi:hypothetical protein
LIEPEGEACGESDGGHEGVSASGVDASPVLEASEHVFDLVALAIERAVTGLALPKIPPRQWCRPTAAPSAPGAASLKSNPFCRSVVTPKVWLATLPAAPAMAPAVTIDTPITTMMICPMTAPAPGFLGGLALVGLRSPSVLLGS